MQTWTFAFFTSSQPTSTDGGCSSPFEPLKNGFVTGTTGATSERREWKEQTPPLIYERGKPGGEGEGQYKPPLKSLRSTLD